MEENGRETAKAVNEFKNDSIQSCVSPRPTTVGGRRRSSHQTLIVTCRLSGSFEIVDVNGSA